MFVATFVSFCGLLLLLSHLSSSTMRRLVGYKGWIDVMVHTTIIGLFIGTSTMGLLQAEAAGILFSIYLRVYRWSFGYERLRGTRWVRYAGRFT